MTPEDERSQLTVEVKKDGPYIIKGLQQLHNSRGESIETDAVVALCRCGHSANKPFCDGAHTRVGFSGERLSTGPIDQSKSYVGRKITIHDNRAICAHVGFCTQELPAVFRLGNKPWIDPDGGQVDAIAETVNKCPSGALSYSIDGVHYGAQSRDPMITVSKDGPYFVTGGIGLKSQQTLQPPSKEHYALCRCGVSKNKPFCDGSHWDMNFKDEKN